jgi:hypothetical protein
MNNESLASSEACNQCVFVVAFAERSCKMNNWASDDDDVPQDVPSHYLRTDKKFVVGKRLNWEKDRKKAGRSRPFNLE